MYLSFEVRDTGIGIDKDQLERIFQRFAQAQGSIIREYGGTGLGLSISREIAQLMGGTLGVNSRAGQGSCFTLLLPLKGLSDADDQSMTISVTESRADAMNFKDLTLLLVEDDPVNQAVFKEMVQEFGCRIINAQDGQSAVDCLLAQRVDLVFMDIEMPIMDGLTASRHIRSGKAGQGNCNIPIIAMTAHVLDEFRSKTEAAGMNEFIPKPVDRDELIDILTKYQTIKNATKKLSHIDRDQALASLGGNRELLEKVLKIFISETPGLLNSLNLALETGDLKAVGMAAHALKGAGARIYAQKASSLAADLESMSGQKNPSPDMDQLHGCAQDTLRQFENVIDWLRIGAKIS